MEKIITNPKILKAIFSMSYIILIYGLAVSVTDAIFHKYDV